MYEPHRPTSFKGPQSPILDAACSVDNGVANTQGLIGQMEQLLHELNVHPSLARLHYSKIKIVI